MPEEVIDKLSMTVDKVSLKGHRLQQNRDFRTVFLHGNSVANRYYVLYVLRRRKGEATQVGFSVSKKVGNAVVRNRTKRLLRESLRQHVHHFERGFFLVVIARKEAPCLKMLSDVDKQVALLLKKAKLLV